MPDERRARRMIFFADVPFAPCQRVRPRRLAEEKLGFNFELGQLVRHRARRSRRDTKGGVTIVPGADGGKSWRRAWKRRRRRRRLVARGFGAAPGGTSENKKSDLAAGGREGVRGAGRMREKERKPGGFVTNGDAVATHEAKVPALVARLYTGRHKFRPLPIKP